MVENRIEDLGFELPEAPKPLAAYIPALVVDKLVFTAGQLPMEKGKLNIVGKLGAEVSDEKGRIAAEICALNCLSVIKSVIDDLDRIERVVKLTVFVNSATGFTGQPNIANGASELIGKIFGDKGKHVRSAVGVNELPLNSPVEIEMIVRVK
ncbi:MAG TPA: RidA family protein [Ignavibacteriaceae bacterium]|nr:RidA family protein [Ignavibacteriaceae bacterium]